MTTKLEAVTCVAKGCTRILHERPVGWRGDPIWEICKRCGQYNRISNDGQWIVPAAGKDEPGYRR